MAKTRQALGRGLSALIPETAPPPTDRTTEADLDRLTPNRFQPRSVLDELKLEELSRSIRSTGVIQPIVVRRVGDDRFEIIAGERRWRAAQMAGLLRVPIVVRDIPDDKLLEVALIENLQRENLNPIEVAEAYHRLIEDYNLTQEDVAAAVGKDRATVANYVRLLVLPAEVQADVASGVLAMGHARALLSLAEEADRRRAAREVVAKGLSVRETEGLVKRVKAHSESTDAGSVSSAPPLDVHTSAAQDQLRVSLGTRVRIVRQGRNSNRGRIEIDFGSENELQRLFERLTED
ncbi:MAG: ParB/RepB/Spo0J family partition protein [Acidobacteriota bacterium]|nr:ParB/RepB/Spo0J family partition protein [Acidobacteriota bacterium]